MSKLEQDLRLNIKNELSKVTKTNSPNVWAMFHTTKGKLNQEGYAKLEQRIIKMVIAGQIPPAAVIPQIEMEFE